MPLAVAVSSPAATPCERFAAASDLPPCKVNAMRWCQTDLAANAYSWPRFVADDMRFGVLDSGQGANHDGFMADVVRERKWHVRHCILTSTHLSTTCLGFDTHCMDWHTFELLMLAL